MLLLYQYISNEIFLIMCLKFRNFSKKWNYKKAYLVVMLCLTALCVLEWF